MKKVLSLIMALVMVAGLLCVGVSANETVSDAPQSEDIMVTGDTSNKQINDHGAASAEFAYVKSLSNDKAALTMTATVLTAAGEKTITTKALDADTFALRTSSGSDQISNGTFVDIIYDADGAVIDFARLFNLSNNVFFDTIKYGAELRPVNGKVGNAIASGWVLGKADGSIVIGDTNKFLETYTLAEDAKIFCLDTSKKTLEAKTFADVPVTEKTENPYGLNEFSLTPKRQGAIVVFDKNYEEYEDAKVVELYYLAQTSSVAAKDLVYEYDTMSMYSSFGDYDFDGDGSGGLTSKLNSVPWAAHTKPFVIYPGKLVSVADTDVFMMLLFGENGRMYLLDTSYPGVAYNLFLTIEEAGYDPRDLDGIFNTHGHFDHYGNCTEIERMITNSGGDLDIWGSYEDTYGLAHLGYPDWGPEYTDLAVSSGIDNWYQWLSWMNLGNGLRMYAVNTPGHSKGCGSFVFECTNDETGEVSTFGYIGGMGTQANPSAGVRRLQFLFMLRYMQQCFSCDYSLPQHVGHFPILEINKAGEAAGLTFMEAELTGDEQWCNYLERRTELQSYAAPRLAWLANPVMTVQLADGTSTTLKMQSSSSGRITNEEAGPWKRLAGEYAVTLLDSGKVIHGFDGRENANPLFKGVKNLAGDDMSNGIVCVRDGYVHDPDHWYVQVSMRVHDDYDGQLNNLPNEVNGPIDIKTGNLTKGTNGPAERLMLGDDWFEINRTLAFETREEAEAVLATLEAGKTYTVEMTRTSDIVPAENILDTFKEVTATVEVTEAAAPAANQMAVDVTFNGTTEQGIGAIVFTPFYDDALTLVDVIGAEWEVGDTNIVVNEDVETCTVTLVFDVPANQAVDTTVYAVVLSACDQAENELNFPDYGCAFAEGYILGDANADGRVSASDLVRLRNYIGMNGEGITVGGGADLNGDGEVNGVDLTALNRYFATLAF